MLLLQSVYAQLECKLSACTEYQLFVLDVSVSSLTFVSITCMYVAILSCISAQTCHQIVNK